MASQWYYAIGDKESGPVSSAELKKLADSGQLSPTDQIWKEGMAEWVAASSIPNLFASAPSPAASGAPTINVGDPAPSVSEPAFGDVGGADSFGAPSTMSQPVRGRSSGGSAQDYLTFKKMITPIVIQIVFWILVALSVVAGMFMILGGMRIDSAITMLGGLAYIVLGPLIIRIYCELLIVIFSINDTLLDIKEILKRQK